MADDDPTADRAAKRRARNKPDKIDTYRYLLAYTLQVLDACTKGGPDEPAVAQANRHILSELGEIGEVDAFAGTQARLRVASDRRKGVV